MCGRQVAARLSGGVSGGDSLVPQSSPAAEALHTSRAKAPKPSAALV